MTAKEKAIELDEKFSPLVKCWDCYNDTPMQIEGTVANAKQCAIIAVNEILNLMIKDFKWDIKHNGNIDYWQQVKIEIENL